LTNWPRDTPTGGEQLKGIQYAVVGCGHRDWAATYQAVPKLIDAGLEALGARRICARGEKIGPPVLFTGCRYPEHDFIYADELRAAT
jgi:sulfite reductase alpha subunit-like flavoprotein